mgnify:FL=1
MDMRDISFGYTEYDADGEREIFDRSGKYKNMLMELHGSLMKPGAEKLLDSGEDELVLILLRGKITLNYAGSTAALERGSFITDGIRGLHVSRHTQVKVTAETESEIVTIRTDNDRDFAPVLYTPENTAENDACVGLWDGTAERHVRTAFDYSSMPQSNLVLGETIMPGGKWSGYVPHYHKQPEVYYFRMENPDGFGASFVGEEVFKIKDGSFCAINANLVHPQVAAPGYPIYYLWIIRHLDGNPWIRESCSNEKAHEWLLP